MIGDDLHQGAGAAAECAGDDRDVGQVGQADPRQLEARAQAPADPDPAVDEPPAPLDRVGGHLAFLGALEERVDHPEGPSIQVHRIVLVSKRGRSQRITTRSRSRLLPGPWSQGPHCSDPAGRRKPIPAPGTPTVSGA